MDLYVPFKFKEKKSGKLAYSCASEKTQVWLKLVEKLSESLR